MCAILVLPVLFGLPLGTEAPDMTPEGVDFSSLSIACALYIQQLQPMDKHNYSCNSSYLTWRPCPVQVIKCWRQHLSNRTAVQLLKQYSVPGLLMSGAVLLGKLVQLGSAADLHMQLEVVLSLLSLHAPSPC